MILLDADVLLEMLITGRARQTEVLAWIEQNTEHFCITMLTVHLVLHFGFKDGLTQAELKLFLADYPKLPLTAEDYTAAMALLVGTDHEDALQLAAAERAGCTRIVTLDRQFAQTYTHRIPFTVIGA